MDGTLVPYTCFRGPYTDSQTRFASDVLPEEESLPHLTALMQTYLSTMSDVGAETWIMHGTLLGWWWNQKVGNHGLPDTRHGLTLPRSYRGTAISTSRSPNPRCTS